ncbi:Nuclear transport factor 2 [Mycena kentingensis (nom. inval.)]|nr:Nuclear transport factor 2 [Mycena kentingensis (nom. inval.)]
MAYPNSRILQALQGLHLEQNNAPPLAPVFRRNASAPTPNPKPIPAPKLKATRSAPPAAPPSTVIDATDAPSHPKYSYQRASPPPRMRFTRKEDEADAWVSELDLKGPISVDCEWVVHFRRGPGGGQRPVSLIQIADKNNIILIQIRTSQGAMARFPRALRRVLEDASIPKAGANILNDGKKLFRDYGILSQGLVELGGLARQADPAFNGHGRKVVALAKALSKDTSVRVSNWEHPDLHQNKEMLQYAADDAYSGFQLYSHLLSMAKANDISLDQTKFTSAVDYPHLTGPTTISKPLAVVPVIVQTPDMDHAGVKLQYLRAYRYWALGKRSLDNMRSELRIDKQAGSLAPGTVITYIVETLTRWPKFMPDDLGELRLLLLEDIRSWERHSAWFLSKAGVV